MEGEVHVIGEPAELIEAQRERRPLLVAQQHELLMVHPPAELPDVAVVELQEPLSSDSSRRLSQIVGSKTNSDIPADPILLILSCAILSLVLSIFFTTAITFRGWNRLGTLDLVGIYLAVAPLLFFLFALGFPPTARLFQRWHDSKPILSYLPSASIFICFILLGAFHRTFNPLVVIFILATCVFTFGSLSTARGNRHSFYVDMLVWMFIYVPFSLRWYSIVYYPGPEGYADEWFAVAITTLGVHAWVVGKRNELGYRLVPSSWKDLVVPLVTLTVLSLIVVPIGLATGFLKAPMLRHDAITVLVWFAQHLVTVAMTEEFFFRCVLMQNVNNFWQTKSMWFAQLVSSILFSLMHIPATGPLLDQFLWAGFGFLCGQSYALCFKFTDNKIFAPLITHAVVNALMYWLFEDPTHPRQLTPIAAPFSSS